MTPKDADAASILDFSEKRFPRKRRRRRIWRQKTQNMTPKDAEYDAKRRRIWRQKTQNMTPKDAEHDAKRRRHPRKKSSKKSWIIILCQWGYTGKKNWFCKYIFPFTYQWGYTGKKIDFVKMFFRLHISGGTQKFYNTNDVYLF